MRNSGPKKSGSTLLEFVLAGSFIFLPLLTGTVTVGMSMLRSLQVAALNRSAGHMFASGMDFSQSANRNLLLSIAGDLNISDAGGSGVVILSEIDGTGTNQAVCTRQYVIGNAALRASSFATPAGIDSGGNVINVNEASANTAGFTPAVMPMSQGDVAYVAETYFSTSDYDWTGFLTGTGIYTRAIF
jgi:hypothetical protein